MVHGSITCTPNLIMLGGDVALPIDIVAGSYASRQLPTNRLLPYVDWIRIVLDMSFSTENLN